MNSYSKIILSGAVVLACVSFTFAQQASGTKSVKKGAALQSQVKEKIDKARREILLGNELKANKILDQVVDLAYQAWKLKDVTASEAIFRQVLALKSDQIKALFGLAELYRRTNPLWAVDYYSRYLRVNPGDPAAYFGRGSCYLDRGAYSLAIQDLKYLVDRLEPDHVMGLTNLALALRGRAIEQNYDVDLFKEAVGYMERAVKVVRNSSNKKSPSELPELEFRLGRLTFEYDQVVAKSNPKSADYSKAIAAFQRSITYSLAILKTESLDSKDTAINQIKLSLSALSDVYKAETDIDPKNPKPYLSLARISKEQIRFESMLLTVSAIKYLQKAVEVDPSLDNAWFGLAIHYGDLGMFQKAYESVNKALKLAPDNKNYMQYRANIVRAIRAAKQKKAG